MSLHRFAVVSAVLAAGCVQPTNGFDPDAPAALAEKGTFIGSVALEDPDPTDDLTPSPAGVSIAVVGGPSTTAAADGTFTLGEVDAGLATVRFTFAGHVAAEITAVVERAATTTLSPQTLVLSRTLITGSVDLLGAIDDGGALVEADGFGVKDVTGADGSFSLLVPTGAATSVDVKASRGGFASQRVTVAIDGERAAAPAIVLAPNLGRLVINDGAAVTNARGVTLNLDVAGAARVRASESPAFVEGDVAVAFVPYPASGDLPFTLGVGDGDKVIFVQVEDAAGDVVLLEGGIALDTTPPVLTSVIVDDGDGVTASVSVTVSVSATGASEMVIATDGVVDGELFGPVAPAAIALLPAGDGDKSVCVIVRDAADNRAGPLCATVRLDGSRPSSPQVLLDDTTLVKSPADARDFKVPVVLPGDDVVALQISVEPEGTSARLTRASLVPGLNETFVNVAVDLAVPAVIPQVLPFIGRVVRLRFEDAAGNLSEESTLTIRIDGLEPIAPRVVDADCVSGCDRGSPVVVYEVRRGNAVRRLNADTFVVQLATRVRDVDFNFARFEVAQSVGLQLLPDERDFAPTASVDNLLYTLTQGAPGNGVPPDTQGCSPASCLNHLFLRAVDEAGNVGPLVRVDLIEDSTPPTRPTLTPRDVAMRGGSGRFSLATPSQDRGDTGFADVRAYEIKEGIDGTFEGIPDGQPSEGPWELALAPAALNEICVRGVDEAGNVGIEDCVTVDEQTVRLAVTTSASDNRQAIAGDHILFASGQDVRLRSVVDTPAVDGDEGLLVVSGVGDIGLPRMVQVPTTAGVALEAVFGGNRPGSSGRGIHFVSIAAAGTIEHRFLCGEEADYDGTTGVWFEGTNLVAETRVDMQTAPVSTIGACADRGDPIAAVTNRCPFTRAQVAGDHVVWCDGGAILHRRLSTPGTTRTISAAAANIQQGVLTGGQNATIQPFVDDGLIVWGEGSPPTLRVLPATAPAAEAIDTEVEIAALLDADEGRVLVQVLTDDGLGVDIGIVDLTPIFGTDPRPATFVKLTEDIAPQDVGSLSGFRASWVDLSSFTEDIAVADLSSERPIAASPDFDIGPETSPLRTAWFAVTPEGLGVLSIDHATGAERVALGGNEVTFFGGTVLGRSTIAVGGDLVVGALRGANERWTLQTRLDNAGPVVLATDVRSAASVEPLGDEATAAWGLDEDGRALVYQDGVGIRFQGLPPSLPSFFTATPQTLPGVGATAAYIDVDIDDASGATVVVLQKEAQENNNADLRREGTGPIACATGTLAGTTLQAARGGVVRVGTVDLVGRSPQVAVVGGRTFLSLLRDTLKETRPRLEPVVCELSCGVTPTCTEPRAIGFVGDQAPELSGAGLAVSITFDGIRGGGIGDVVITDLEGQGQVFLTGPIDGTSPRQTARIAGRRVVWNDARLGSFDVWDTILP